MKAILAAAAIALISAPTYAACFGSSSFQTCSDNSGNNYTVQRYGNSTHMQGNNYRTGSSWSQDSYSYGSSTMHSGRDSHGNSWNTSCFNGICN